MGRPTGPGTARRRACRFLRIELLEDRSTPASVADIFAPMVVAGAVEANPSDTPDQRIDPNSKFSPFAGIGSIQVKTKGGSSIGTGIPISRRHILTAAHVIDQNSDGKFDRQDLTQGVYFISNFGGDQTSKIGVAKFKIHPDYTGFNRPSVNDDIAILTLARDLPANIPTYGLPLTGISEGTVLTMVGYGRSGDGMMGYTTSASATVKRVGGNTADAFLGQDDPGRPEVDEVFRFDFDGPDGSGPLGGESLGNTVETTIGPGDSGGPAFVPNGSGYSVVGLNTFTQGANAPKFGSMGGGVILSAYMNFINSVLRPGAATSGGGTTPPAPPPSGGGGTLPPPPPLPGGGVLIPDATAVSEFVSASVRSVTRTSSVSIASDDSVAERAFDLFSTTLQWNLAPKSEDGIVPSVLTRASSTESFDLGVFGLVSGLSLITSDD